MAIGRNERDLFFAFLVSSTRDLDCDDQVHPGCLPLLFLAEAAGLPSAGSKPSPTHGLGLLLGNAVWLTQQWVADGGPNP